MIVLFVSYVDVAYILFLVVVRVVLIQVQVQLQGGFSDKFAKHVAPILQKCMSQYTSSGWDKLSLVPDSIKHNVDGPASDSIQVWSASSGHAVVGIWEGILEEHEQVVSDKKGSHDAKMTDNPSWLGCIGSIGIDAKKLREELEFADDLDGHRGAGVWLSTNKPNKPRIGPTACPLTCTGQLICPSDKDTFLILCRTSAILKSGIALNDLKFFLNGPSGAAFIESDNFKVLYIIKGSVVYVPWGWVAIPLLYEHVVDKKLRSPGRIAITRPCSTRRWRRSCRRKSCERRIG